ncbi:MAG: radical SAM protein [bacterium]
MKVLLTYPRWDYPIMGELQEPLGIMSVGAALSAAGHEVKLLDLAVDGIEELDRLLPESDLVGLSSSTALYGRACRVLDRVREQSPNLPVILGGPHATVVPEEVIARGFDAASIGEGEATAVEIAQAICENQPLYRVPGVVARRGERIMWGPARPFLKDMDGLPDPDRSLADYEGYFQKGLSQVGIMASRGCPYNCLFCKPMQDKLFGRKIRRRPVKNIVQEMERCVSMLGNRRFLFRDDTMALAGMEWFNRFESALEASSLTGPAWSCQARVDQVNGPLLEKMKSCGLKGMAFGVESGSQKVLDYYRKGIKLEQTVKAFETCHRLGIGTHAFIMLGAPVETPADLEMTANLVRSIRPDSVSISITTPAPGTDLYYQVIESGLYNLSSHEESDYYFNERPIKLPYLSPLELAEAGRAILEAVPGAPSTEQMQRIKCIAAGNTQPVSPKDV